MLKKIYSISILRTVRSTLSRFFAIFAIVALGVGFLAGLLTSPVDMRLSAESYYDAYQMYDMQVVSTQGLTADDLTAVQELDGVEKAVAVKDTDLVLQSPAGSNITVRMHTMPGETADTFSLNKLQLLDGRFPENAGECVVVSAKTLVESPVKIGDSLILTEDNAETTREHSPSAFTVVGFVKTPAYLSIEKEHTNVGSGTISMVAYTPPASFSYDYYTAIYLTLSGALPLDSFGSAYDELVDKTASALEEIRPQRETLRYEAIKTTANNALQDAEQEYSSKKAEAEQKLADAQKELDDGRAKIADGENQLVAARQQITDGENELALQKEQFQSTITEKQAQIDNGYAQIQSYQTQLQNGETQLTAAQREYQTQNSQIEQLEAGKAAFIQSMSDAGMPLADHSDAAVIALIQSLLENQSVPPDNIAPITALRDGLSALAASGTTLENSRQALQTAKTTLDAKTAELAAQKQQLAAQKSELDSAAIQLENGKAAAQEQFAAAESKLTSARSDYENGLAELESSKIKLAEGQKEYDSAKQEADQKLVDGKQKINEAKQEIDDIQKGKWYIKDRMDNTSFASFSSNADKIANIAKVFPVFFFLVAALVALTTMTRMVDEERLQIGTLKALGYTTVQIAAKYLLYAAFASITGSAAGMAIGMKILPTIIMDAYNIMYDLPAIFAPFHLAYGLLAGSVAVLCTLAATLNACWSALREAPAKLMLPKAPKAGKRILLERFTFLWKNMKFTHKVTARNLFLYKKRFIMTIVGIAGCTALLVTGFGIRDSISNIAHKQFVELQNYQMLAALDDTDEAGIAKLQQDFKKNTRIADTLAVLQNDSKIIPANKNRPADSLIIEVPESTEKLNTFFNFRHRTNSKPVIFDENAVVITEKLAERQHLSIGDTITVENKNNVRASFTITDICENYTYHYLFLSQASYEAAFGEKATPNILLLSLAESTENSTLPADLLGIDGIAGVEFTSEIASSFEKSITSINYIVYVLIVSAGALAFVVLYNLTNINITEREKELATIKVLGFYDREVSAYIYRETAMLTLIGTLCGLGFGVLLHQFVIRTSEVDLVMFGRSIYGLSYLWAALLTIIFALLVNLVMYRKLKHINMVESLKAPE